MNDVGNSSEYPFERESQSKPSAFVWFAVFLSAAAVIIVIINVFGVKNKDDDKTSAYIAELQAQIDEFSDKFADITDEFDDKLDVAAENVSGVNVKLDEVSGQLNKVANKFKKVNNEFYGVTVKMKSLGESIRIVDEKSRDRQEESKSEKAIRGKMELQKALISFQQAQKLIADQSLDPEFSKIQEELMQMISPDKEETLELKIDESGDTGYDNKTLDD